MLWAHSDFIRNRALNVFIAAVIGTWPWCLFNFLLVTATHSESCTITTRRTLVHRVAAWARRFWDVAAAVAFAAEISEDLLSIIRI